MLALSRAVLLQLCLMMAPAEGASAMATGSGSGTASGASGARTSRSAHDVDGSGVNLNCPAGTTKVDAFSAADGSQWSACEDLQAPTPGGGLTLVPTSGDEPAVHFPKGYEKYRQGADEDYPWYLRLGKQTVLNAKWDMLGDACCAALGARPGAGARWQVRAHVGTGGASSVAHR